MDIMIGDVDAQINAILDITENNLFEAVFLVCSDIEVKGSHSLESR